MQTDFDRMVIKKIKLLNERVTEIEKAFEILKVALETKVSDASSPR